MPAFSPRKLVFLSMTLIAPFALGSAARADIVVGIAGPMTGQYASYGAEIRQGAEAALADINASGGVLGQKLVLEIGDDACDPSQAVAVANQMVTKHIAFMHGHFCSGSTIPASEVYAEADIPEVTVSSSPGVTDRGYKNIFRITARDDQQGAFAATFIAGEFANKRIALVDDKSSYGKGLVNEVAKGLAANKIPIAFQDSITAGDKDFSALITKMKHAGVEFVFFGGYHIEAGLMVRQAREAGATWRFMSGDTLTNSEFWSIAGSAANGVLFTFLPDPRQIPEAAPLVKRFRDQGFEPEGWTIYSYAAMQLFAKAAEQAKSTKFADIEPVMRSGRINTAAGLMVFDAKGDRLEGGSFIAYEWKDGSYHYFEK